MCKLFVQNSIRTNSGLYVNVLDPHPNTILIEDIAHGLSNTNRFGGHTRKPYSVALHSIQAYLRAAPENKLEALLHDATEAYLCDIPSPLKSLLPEYKVLEERMYKVIAKKFGIPETISECVKKLDRALLVEEFDVYFLNEISHPSAPEEQVEIFLKLYNEGRSR